MPRIRTLKPEALQHRKVGRLTDRCFRLWVAMLTQADDEGRLVADAGQLRLLTWGYHDEVSEKEVAAALEEVVRTGLVRTYTVQDIQYADFPSWPDHQRIHKHHFTSSKLPPPPTQYGSSPVSVREQYGTRTVGSEGSEGSERIGSEGGECEGRDRDTSFSLVSNEHQQHSNDTPLRRPAPGEYQEVCERIRAKHPELTEAQVEADALKSLQAALRMTGTEFRRRARE